MKVSLGIIQSGAVELPIVSSDKKIFHDMTGHICEPEIATGMAVGQFFVVEPEQGEQGRVEVVDVNFVLGRKPAIIVSGSVGETRLYASTGKPHGEPFGIMVAAIPATLGSRSAPELTSPKDEGVLEQTSSLQIL